MRSVKLRNYQLVNNDLNTRRAEHEEEIDVNGNKNITCTCNDVESKKSNEGKKLNETK